jgi:hypothetical protein
MDTELKNIMSQCPNFTSCDKFIDCHKRCCQSFSVWKRIGDEIIFESILRCKEQPLLFVETAKNVLNGLNNHFRSYIDKQIRIKKKDLSSLSEEEKEEKEKKKKVELRQLRKIKNGMKAAGISFKGTLWVAAFPLTNIELFLAAIGQSGFPYDRDYFGPSIDLGFRLAKFATMTRLVLSTSLVYLICKQKDSEKTQLPDSEQTQLPNLPIYTSGKVEIKGLPNKEDALFWVIPNEKEEAAQVDLLLHKDKIGDLKKFFKRKYYRKIPPFIEEVDDYDKEKYFKLYEKEREVLAGINNTVFADTVVKDQIELSIISKTLMNDINAIDSIVNSLPDKYKNKFFTEVTGWEALHIRLKTKKAADQDQNTTLRETLDRVEEQLRKPNKQQTEHDEE